MPETCPTPFTTRRTWRDEKDENDAHSIEIKIARSNEIQSHQTHGQESELTSELVPFEETLQLNVNEVIILDHASRRLEVRRDVLRFDQFGLRSRMIDSMV